MTRTRTFERAARAAWVGGWALLLLVAAACPPAGCAAGGKPRADPGPAYDQLYSGGRYAEAYEEASKVAGSLSGKDKQHAALVAGLSAHALNKNPEAEKWLRPLTTSSDPQVAGESLATLGLILQEQSRHAQAAEMLAGAAGKLTGDQGARAALYAGDSYRALGKRDDATKMYELARSKAERDNALKVMISDRIAGVPPPPKASTVSAIGGRAPAPNAMPPMRGGAFTVQVGAFSTPALAQKEAAKFARWGAPQITPITKNGRTLYAVRLGSFATKADAENFRRQIGSSARVVAIGS
jgi:tetratricopeptide (TPR) repeat protein